MLRNNQWRLYAGELEEEEELIGTGPLRFGQFNDTTTRNLVTGQSCSTLPAEIPCLRPDGSGWYRVGNQPLEDGQANHRFSPSAPGVGTRLDDAFLNDNLPFSLGPSMDFLTSRTDPPPGCDRNVSAFDQLQNGRIALRTVEFGTALIFVFRPTGTSPETNGFLNIATFPAPNEGFGGPAFAFLVQTLQQTMVSLRQTSPGMFELCEPGNFPRTAIQPQ